MIFTSDVAHIQSQLMNTHRREKPKMLVVDDEPDNLDLLYRTFRRDFHVLKAESGVRALELLATEGEVAIIISDQRMPEMKGTEFLSRTLPQFPNTVRIILTGFTDIEDLVEAINSGQVYKYITKPWDPNELKNVVQKATETYELLNQRAEELSRAQLQTELLSKINDISQQADDFSKALKALAGAFAETFNTDICILQMVQDKALTAESGIWGEVAPADSWLAEDPLTIEAIASEKTQVVVNTTADANLTSNEHYQKTGIKSHLVMPLIYRGNIIGILSLQWCRSGQLHPDEVNTLVLCGQQLVLALACLR
jgi:CheY-like chemotaxis protein